MPKYPPLWSAAVLGVVLAAASEHLPPSLRPQSVGPDWQRLYPIALVVLALVTAVLLRWLLRDGLTKQPHPTAISDEEISWPTVAKWIRAGERPITSGERDLFQHHRVASRIAHAVGVEGRPLALLGEFGTGKTSILNLARAEMEGCSPTVVAADFDVWAVPKPEEIPRLALSKIVAALDHHIDTIELRNLPFTYQRLVAAEPTGRLARIFGLETAADSLEVIGRLTHILEVLDARLVLIVQDIERLGRGFDTRHLERLLWALRQVERASFILALDPARSPLDYSKLCDTIELVPSVEARHARTILRVAYVHWTRDFSYIDPHENRPEGGKLGLATLPQDTMEEYISRAGGNTPLDAMVSLLRAPRALKHVLRQVDHAWQKLHGEADLDDLIVVATLRHGAEPAYKFLIRAVDAARNDPNDMLPRTTTVKKEWKRRKRRLPNGPAVQRLVDLLGIKQLTAEPTIYGTSSPQGVHVSEPIDYFRRIAAEDLGPTELRDQVVLRDIERWMAAREGDLVQKLVDASEGVEQYPRVWRQFSSTQSDTELMELTEAVVTGVLERDGPAAAGDHPSVIALWVACSRRPRRGQFDEWVRDLILRAVPISLNLVNDLFYYWTGRNGVVPEAQRDVIRRAIIEAVRESVRTGRDLTRRLTTHDPYTITRLITGTDVDTSVSAYEVWRDYLPPLLIEAAKDDPEIIMPELANLAGDEQSGYRAVGPQYPPVFVRRYKIDRVRMNTLFGERLDEVLSLLAEYDGINAYAVRAKDDARSWLEERRSQKEGE